VFGEQINEDRAKTWSTSGDTFIMIAILGSEGASTTVDNQSLNAVVIGESGPAIILLHGWGHSIESMRPLGELLSQSAQVHLIDLPGFGKSPKPTEDWDTVGYANRIYQYLEDNKIQSADLLGHSFGGRVSIRLASRHPERVRSVVLINSGGLKRTLTGKKKIRAQLIGFLSKTIKQIDKLTSAGLFQSWFVPRFGSADYKNAGPLRNILVKTVTEDVSEDAAKITSPTFILWGELDQETPVESGQRLHALIQNSQLVILPGKDHYCFMGSGAHLCASYIIKFLNAQPGGGKASTPGGGAADHA
jgi:pimeloyl-ACP methyl ester carboxylesterase